MTGKLYINGTDAWTEWGVFLEEGSYDKLLSGESMKPYTTNRSRNKDGKMVMIKNPRVEDRDFSGEVDGEFVYIGTDDYVTVPNIIKGVTITKTNNMFGSGAQATVKGVAMQEGNSVTDMSYMSQNPKAITLDLLSFDTNKTSITYGMFYNIPTTKGYARTQADVDKFNRTLTTFIPPRLTFVVKQ